MEIWRDIKGFEGKYQISNFGNVKSLPRYVIDSDGIRVRFFKGKMLSKHNDGDGYYKVGLSIGGYAKPFKIHQLVAVAFLGHISNGYDLVINHIDFNRTNNHVNNLEIVTVRENTNRKHIKSSSIYTGVCLNKKLNKWVSNIRVDGNLQYLGLFVDEYDAHLAYENALSELTLTNQKSKHE